MSGPVRSLPPAAGGPPSALQELVDRAAGEICPQEIPSMLGELERLRATLWARLMATPAERTRQPAAEPDRWLTIDEACAIARVSRRWFYQRVGKVPFIHRLSRKRLLISERGLRRWLDARRP